MKDKQEEITRNDFWAGMVWLGGIIELSAGHTSAGIVCLIMATIFISQDNK